MESRLISFPLPPSLEGGDEPSPFPSSPSTTDSASETPEKDFENESGAFDCLTSTPLGKVPPNSAMTTPDVKTPSGASSTEPSPPGSSYGHPYGYGEREGDFWSSIQKHYDELMDDGLIEKCKDVESDFSLEEESDSPATSSVSFTEFLEQYKELSDWLLHMKHTTVQTVHSQSEKYLNQSYQEEMLQRSPRRKLFKEYARRLQRRFPHLKEDICTRLSHLNRQWKELESQITGRKSDDQLEVIFVDDALRSPVFDAESSGGQSFLSMSADLETDLDMLRNWLASVENRLGPLTMRKVQEMGDLEEKLREYQSIQREIESQARVISAVFKLCDRLDSHRIDDGPSLSRDDVVATAVGVKPSTRREERKSYLRSEATAMQNRWHKVWLLALEWQCCLEERLSQSVVYDFSLSPYLHKNRPVSPGFRGNMVDPSSPVSEKGSSSLDLTAGEEISKPAIEAPSLDEGDGGTTFEPLGAAAPEVAHVSIGTENVCNCGFMNDEVCVDGVEMAGGESSSKRVLCWRCKRPTKDRLDAETLERDALLSTRDDIDDRAIQELVRLFDNKDANYVDALLHKQHRAQQRLAEPHDIGYSSEGLSNDEDGGVFSPRVLAPRDTGLDTLSEAPKYEQDVPGNEAKFFPPAALEVFHVQNVDEEEEQQQLQQQAVATEAPNAIERLKKKYGLGSVFVVSDAAESSDLSCIFGHGLDRSRDSLGSASAATDLDQTETDPLEKSPPRHRKSLVRRDSIQKLVMEVEDLIAHERDKTSCDYDVDGDSTLTRQNRRKRRAFPSEEASAELTSTENVSLADGDGERNLRGESGSHSSDWDFYRDGDVVASGVRDPTLNVTVRSVTEMYEQSLGVDLSPFAIDDHDGDGSEDAVDGALGKSKIYDGDTFPRGSSARRNLSFDEFNVVPKINHKLHKMPPKYLSGLAAPQTEEFYISDQVWEYEDFADGGDVEGGIERASPAFVVNHDQDDSRFRPTSTDDVDDDDDEDAISDRRRSDASFSSTPPLAPPNFLFRPLAPQRRDDEDSDSDCEELRHVLEESRAQLQVTDVTLGKIKREMIEKGNFLEPSKYKELLATCQTNIKCLQVIHQHLKTPNQTSIPDDVGEIEEIIERWEVLQAVTADKQSRCRALKELSANLVNVVEFRDEAAASLVEPRRVDGLAQLDAFIFDLRSRFFGIAEHKSVLQQTRDGLTEFADSNPRYSVQRIRDSVDIVDDELTQLGREYEERLGELEVAYSRWAEMGEKMREVVFGIQDLRRPGKMLRRAATKSSEPSDGGSQSEVNGIEDDDRVLKKRARALEEDLEVIERSSRCIEAVSSESAREKLAIRFVALREEVGALTATEWIGVKEGLAEESEISEEEIDDGLLSMANRETASAGFLSSGYKFVLVVLSIVGLLLGLAFVVSPDCCFTRNNLKWSLQPQLRYSDGPPPQ